MPWAYSYTTDNKMEESTIDIYGHSSQFTHWTFSAESLLEHKRDAEKRGIEFIKKSKCSNLNEMILSTPLHSTGLSLSPVVIASSPQPDLQIFKTDPETSSLKVFVFFN